MSGNLISLSTQQLVDCDPASNGCAGGYYFNAFGWVINNGGIDTEADYPYIAKTGTCRVRLIQRLLLLFNSLACGTSVKLDLLFFVWLICKVLFFFFLFLEGECKQGC